MANSGSYDSGEIATSAIVRGLALPIDADGGVDLCHLPPGTILEVDTRNTTYTLIPQESGEVLIWGHPEYCPEPVLVRGLGGTYPTGTFRECYLSPGMRLNFPNQDRRISTSRIIAIRPKRRN